jgi:hypothetical protein
MSKSLRAKLWWSTISAATVAAGVYALLAPYNSPN